MPLKSDPNQTRVVHLKRTTGKVGAMSSLAAKSDPLVGDDIDRASSDGKGLRMAVKMTIQNRQARTEVVPSATALITKALKPTPRDKKKPQNIRHSGKATFDETVNTARHMQHQLSARELSAVTKEALGALRGLWGPARSVGHCVVCGLWCWHPPPS